MQSDAVSTAPVGVLERNLHLGFRILAASTPGARALTAAITLACRSCAAKKGLKKIAEASSTEHAAEVVELHVHASPARRRRELGAVLPVRPELIITFALLRVGKNLVRLVDLLKSVFGYLVARIDIWMILAGKLTISLTNLCIRGVALNAEQLVVIFERDRH